MYCFSLAALLRANRKQRRAKEHRILIGTFSSKSNRQSDVPHEAALMSTREATWLAWYMCFLSLGLTALGLLLLVLSQEHSGVPVFEQWAEDAVVAVGFSTVGAVVAPRFPAKNPVGWLFCAIGLVGAVLLFSGEYAAYSLLAYPGSLPAGELFAWILSWLWVVHVGLFVFLGLLFPDGRPPTPRWRPFAWLVVAAVVVGTLTAAYSPGPVGGLDALSNPGGVEGLPNLSDSVEVLVFALTLAAAGSLLVRLRRARDVERQQVKWFAYAGAVLASGSTVLHVVSDALGARWLHWELGFVATMVGLAGLPVALGIAVLRYRLHDIDLIINRTLVYGILTATLAGIFEVNVVAFQHVLLVLTHVEDSEIAYFATAMVMAALFDPLKRRIDAFVERRFFRRSAGDRPIWENAHF
jgi:hypothetical protein